MAVNSSNSAITQFLRDATVRNDAGWLAATTFLSHGARALTPNPPSAHIWTRAGGLVNQAPNFPFQVDHYFELRYLAVVFQHVVTTKQHPKFDETDLVFVASIANMAENLFNLTQQVHNDKTNYFGEIRLVTLAAGVTEDKYSYLVAAAPVSRAGIDQRRQLLFVSGVDVGFKVDFLNEIMETPFYHGDWNNYTAGQPNAISPLGNPLVNIWCQG